MANIKIYGEFEAATADGILVEPSAVSSSLLGNNETLQDDLAEIMEMAQSASSGVATSFSLEINPQTFVITWALKDKNDSVLSSGDIDLPLETMVVSGALSDDGKSIILTLQNGETVQFGIADLISGLATTEYVDTSISDLGLGSLSKKDKVANSDIEQNAVTTNKISNKTITEAKLADDLKAKLVTTDTDQTISGEKTYVKPITVTETGSNRRAYMTNDQVAVGKIGTYVALMSYGVYNRLQINSPDELQAVLGCEEGIAALSLKDANDNYFGLTIGDEWGACLRNNDNCLQIPEKSGTLATLDDIGDGGDDGKDGLSTYWTTQTSPALNTSTTSLTKSNIQVPEGRTLQIGDFIVGNSTYSYRYKVTAIADATVTVSYINTMRGATGSTGSSGYAGYGIAYVTSASVIPTSRTSTFTDINGTTFRTPYYSTYNYHLADLIITADTGAIYYYNGNSSNPYTDSGKSIFGTKGDKGDTGNDGSAATIQVGTVTTGTAGSSASVTNVGTTSAAKFNFVIPKGDKGDTGNDGADGTGVTITSTSVTYKASTSGTSAPTGTWSSSVPTVSQGQYLWTKTVVNYSDGKSTTAYSVSYNAKDGSGASIDTSKLVTTDTDQTISGKKTYKKAIKVIKDGSDFSTEISDNRIGVFDSSGTTGVELVSSISAFSGKMGGLSAMAETHEIDVIAEEDNCRIVMNNFTDSEEFDIGLDSNGAYINYNGRLQIPEKSGTLATLDDIGSGGDDVAVDSDFDANSANPLQNKVITKWVKPIQQKLSNTYVGMGQAGAGIIFASLSSGGDYVTQYLSRNCIIWAGFQRAGVFEGNIIFSDFNCIPDEDKVSYTVNIIIREKVQNKMYSYSSVSYGSIEDLYNANSIGASFNVGADSLIYALFQLGGQYGSGVTTDFVNFSVNS